MIDIEATLTTLRARGVYPSIFLRRDDVSAHVCVPTYRNGVRVEDAVHVLSAQTLTAIMAQIVALADGLPEVRR